MDNNLGDLGLPLTKVGSIAQSLGATLIDRGWDEAYVKEQVVAIGDDFVAMRWDTLLGPAVDDLALEIGLQPYPPEDEEVPDE